MKKSKTWPVKVVCMYTILIDILITLDYYILGNMIFLHLFMVSIVSLVKVRRKKKMSLVLSKLDTVTWVVLSKLFLWNMRKIPMWCLQYKMSILSLILTKTNLFGPLFLSLNIVSLSFFNILFLSLSLPLHHLFSVKE